MNPSPDLETRRPGLFELLVSWLEPKLARAIGPKARALYAY